MKKLLMIAVPLLCAAGSYAMSRDTDTTHRPKIFDKFQLRQSFQDASGKESPAQLYLSLPSSGRSNWLVDAGVSARFVPLSNKYGLFNVVAEFHRNTLIDSVQYNWQLGLNYNYLHAGPAGKYALAWTGNLKYVRDVTDTSHSIATTLSLALYRSGKEFTNFGRPAYSADYKHTYQLDPSVQIQYQQYLGNDTHSGAIVRPLADIAASYSWNGERKAGLAPPKKFEIAIDYANRYAVLNKTGNGEGYSKLLRTGINYYFLNTNTKTVSIGASYNRGSDPLNGLKDQNFLQFAFQVQI